MKITYRIPGEMYEYVEVEREFVDTVSAETIAENRDVLRQALAPKPINELPAKDMDVFIENIIACNMKNHTETWELMSPVQREWAKRIDRAVTRLSARAKRQEDNNN